MSGQYTCFVLPSMEDMARPLSAGGVMAVLDVLTSLKWGQRADAYPVLTSDADGKRLRTTATSAADFEQLIGARRAFRVELPETPGEEWWPDPLDSDGASQKYEFSSSEAGVLEARHCFQAELCWAPILFSAPADAINGSPTPCPACGTEVLNPHTGAPEIAALERAHFFAAVPASCPSCSAVFDPSQLVMQLHSPATGELMPERAPFGRWMIAFETAVPLVYPHTVDPQLMDALREAVGGTYRCVGRPS